MIENQVVEIAAHFVLRSDEDKTIEGMGYVETDGMRRLAHAREFRPGEVRQELTPHLARNERR